MKLNMKKFSIDRLFYNDKFVFAFSLLTSVILWFAVTASDTEDHPRAIKDVPVVITLSEAAQADGLKVFSPTDAKATVNIKGNSLVVNQVDASDLQVVAPSASTITTPNTYSLPLVAQKTEKRNLTDFTVSSVSPDQAAVVVDRYKEKTFPIQSDITYRQDYKSDPAYFVGAPTLSSDTIAISGPEKQVQQVNRVAFEYEIGGTLTESKHFTAAVILFDVNGNKITDSGLTLSLKQVDVTIPVLKRQVLPLDAVFTNKPAGLTIDRSKITISPQSIEVAGPADVLSNLKNVSLAPIDFSDVSPANGTFDVDISLPDTCKNLSNIPTAKVTLSLDGLITRSIRATHFSVKNLAADKTAQVYTKSLSVTVVGPPEEISQLTESNLVGEISMSGKENFTGHTEMPVTFSISSASRSWVYGSYMANISVSEKS